MIGRRIILAVIGIAIAATVLQWSLRTPDVRRPAPNTSATPTAATDSSATPAANSGPATATPPATVPPPNEPPADPTFARWLEQEGAEMNQPQVDSKRRDEAMKKAIAELNPTKLQQLLQTVLNPMASAGARIYSVYLMSEAGEIAQGHVAAFLSQPVPSFGESRPHSEAEVRNSQERAMRLMAIDGLAARAQKDPSALATLESTVGSIKDPMVRKYAEGKLQESRSK